MAERRMFSKSVVDSDLFLDMPLTTQALYFHLAMRADDDGFVNSPKKIQRSIGASSDDMKLLAAKGFVIPFESGVIVIVHWKVHNYIRKDRYQETRCIREKEQLSIGESGEYLHILSPVSVPDTVGIPNDNQRETQDRLGKDRIGKVNSNTAQSYSCDSSTPEQKPAEPAPVFSLPLNDKTLYGITGEQLEKWRDYYPAVDVMAELRKMAGWLDGNPGKRKTRRGIGRFIANWLAREQDRGGRAPAPSRGGTPPEKSLSRMVYDGDNADLLFRDLEG